MDNILQDGHYVIYDAEGHKQCVTVQNGVVTIQTSGW